MASPYRIGLIGLGHVGTAFAERLVRDHDAVQAAAGRPITLEMIAVAHPEGRRAPAPLAPADRVIADRRLDAIVELVGGLEPAHTYIYEGLRAGRQMITANKQVIARFGPDLAMAGPLRFEASVASAIPVVEMLAETLSADRIESVTGILNGTTNFILSAMAGGRSYDAALADAKAAGLAEADPSEDVDGHDAAAKLAILVMLAFRRRVDAARIERTGIRQVRRAEVGNLKLIAAARQDADGGIQADVRPRRVPAGDPLASVEGAMNAIRIEAAAAGPLVLIGRGAGPDAAASAVLADVLRAARGTPPSAGQLLAGLARQPAAVVRPFGLGAAAPPSTG